MHSQRTPHEMIGNWFPVKMVEIEVCCSSESSELQNTSISAIFTGNQFPIISCGVLCGGLSLSFVILRNFTVAKISIQKDTYAPAGQR